RLYYLHTKLLTSLPNMSLQNFRSRFYRTTHYYHPQLIFHGQNGTSFKGEKKLEIRDFDPFST
ncbi:hypothetical protein PFFCH_05762, partial [Plasmodium falciparum FCH/4]